MGAAGMGGLLCGAWGGGGMGLGGPQNGVWVAGPHGRPYRTWGQGEMEMGSGGDGPAPVVGEGARPAAPQCCSCAPSPTHISELGAAARRHAVPKAVPRFWELGEAQTERGVPANPPAACPCC